jgi:ribosomal-protein-alanine N-acetyltransferase
MCLDYIESHIGLLLICPAINADLPSIVTIEQTAEKFPWTEKMLHDCLNDNYHFWVIKKQEEIIGFIIFQIYAYEGHIHNIVIKKNKQNQGIGGILLLNTLDFMQKQKVEKTFLEVRRSNQKALNLYKKVGFQAISIRKNYYQSENGREDAIVLTVDHKSS